MSIILVTHDLAIVAQTCDRVAVVYAGRVMEIGSVADIFRRPAHAYTAGLLGSVPSGQAARQKLAAIPGAPPDLSLRHDGCPFAPRCAFVAGPCRSGRPIIVDIGPGHQSPAFAPTACSRRRRARRHDHGSANRGRGPHQELPARD